MSKPGRARTPTLFDDDAEPLDLELPDAPPQVVYGVRLNGTESAIWERTVREGVFTRPSWFPVFSSPIPALWARWCEENGIPCREVPGP